MLIAGDRELTHVEGRFDGRVERSDCLLFGLVDVALVLVAYQWSEQKGTASLTSPTSSMLSRAKSHGFNEVNHQ